MRAWLYFLNGQTGVKIPVGVGQKTAFLERRWGRDGEGLLKARPHTNVRYSNEQSGPFEYHQSLQWRPPTKSVTLCKSINLCGKFHKYQFDEGVSGEDVGLKKKKNKKLCEIVSDMLLLHLFFTA